MRILKMTVLAMLLIPALVLAKALYNEFELLASRTETVTDNLATAVNTIEKKGTRFKLDQGNMRCFLDVTAASGTSPTLDVDIIGVVATKRYVLGSFAQATTTGDTDTILVNDAPHQIAVDWTIAGGSPSFTFNIQCARR